MTALGGTILALAIGGVVALVVSLTDIRARNAFVFCFVLPMMIAPQVVALAWLQLFGPASPLLKALGVAQAIGGRNPLYSPQGIILVLGVQYAPLVFLTLRAGLRTLPRAMIEAGLAGGAGPLTVLRTIVLPLMTPPLVAGVALTFVSCLGNFGIPALLGIPGNYLVLPTLIYQRMAGLGPGVLADVSVLSMLIGFIAIVGILLQDLMLSRRDFRISTTSSAARPFELHRWRLPVEVALWTLDGARAGAAADRAGAELVRSGGGRSAVGQDGNARQLSSSSCSATMRRGARSSTASACRRRRPSRSSAIAVPLAYFLVWRRSRLLHFVNFVIEVPYALPGVVLAIAAILLFLKPLPLVGVSLYNTVWIILFCYLARFLVLGLRPVISGYYQIDRTLEEASQIAGARFGRRLVTIILPLDRARGDRRRAADLSHRVQRADGLGAAVVVGRRNARRHLLLVPARRRFDVRGGARRAHRRRHHRADAVDAADGRPPARRRPSMARLTIDRVTKSFGAFRALDDVSLEVANGEFMAILGRLRLRQDDAAAPDRRLRQARRRPHPDRRYRRIRRRTVMCRPSGGASASCSSRMRCGRT